MINNLANKYSQSQLFFTLLILVVITLLFRIPGYDSTPFWTDELWRVNLFLDPEIVNRYFFISDPQTSITSPIYILINKLISFISISSFTFRLSSLIPSILVVILSFLFLRNLGGNPGLCILVSLFFSTNSQFIRYSNELKPYMLEVFVHCVCMYFWSRIFILNSTNNSNYKSLFIVLFISILTTVNIIFILPSIFITLINKNRNNKHITLYILKFGILPLILTVLFCYFFIWSSGTSEGMISFWNEGFINTNNNNNYFFWLTSKFLEIFKDAFLFSTGMIPNRKYWFFVSLFILYLFIFKRNLINLHFLKVISSFYLIFIFFLIAFNFFKLWPLGNLRPNLFIYCHIFICFGFIFIALKKINLLSWLLALGLIIFIIQLTQSNFGVLVHYSPPKEEHDKVWHSFSNASPLVSMINKECNLNQESVFFLSPSMRYAFNYHLRYDQVNHLYRSVLLKSCIKIITLSDRDLYDKNNLLKFINDNTNDKQSFWFLYSFVYDENVNKIREVFQQVGHIDTESIFVNAGLFHVVR